MKSLTPYPGLLLNGPIHPSPPHCLPHTEPCITRSASRNDTPQPADTQYMLSPCPLIASVLPEGSVPKPQRRAGPGDLTLFFSPHMSQGDLSPKGERGAGTGERRTTQCQHMLVLCEVKLQEVQKFGWKTVHKVILTHARTHTRTPTVGAVIVSGGRGGTPSQLSAVVLACQGSVPPCGTALREVGG